MCEQKKITSFLNWSEVLFGMKTCIYFMINDYYLCVINPS